MRTTVTFEGICALIIAVVLLIALFHGWGSLQPDGAWGSVAFGWLMAKKGAPKGGGTTNMGGMPKVPPHTNMGQKTK